MCQIENKYNKKFLDINKNINLKSCNKSYFSHFLFQEIFAIYLITNSFFIFFFLLVYFFFIEFDRKKYFLQFFTEK